ncbi:MAG TPA: hypothetical protein DCF61_13590, partial [Alphaproteobacteria bacterium]|nr:hypothetical protein [Alphaproteobacteria bacterium]
GALAAAREAVAIRRELAAARPEVYRPNLATSLINLGSRLSENGDAAAALSAAQEAIKTLAPAFHALPRRHAALMRVMAEDYLAYCDEADIEPDAALLDPIIAKLKRLADEGDGEAG